jgi:hypothetical protein
MSVSDTRNAVGWLQALAHLPYLVALDHETRSVVLAVRGTYSMQARFFGCARSSELCACLTSVGAHPLVRTRVDS